MRNRRLVYRLTGALVLMITLLGLFVPRSIEAIQVNSIVISSIEPAFCTPYVGFTRTANNNDGGSGIDYYRLVVADNTGLVLKVVNFDPTFNTTVTKTPFSVILNQFPASSATSFTVYIYDQITGNAADPNGPLVTQSAPFSPLPAGCKTTGQPPAGTAAVFRCPFHDGRLNSCDAGQTAAVYCSTGTVNVYAVDATTSAGRYAFSASPAEIVKVPFKPAKNTAIKSNLGATLYRLTSGELQVNRLEPTGKMYAYIFAGC